ncbi:acyl-CoA dehydrogenase family protein [Chloroflexota bacterium]
MEFGFTEEQERLRKEIHDFLITALPEDFEPVGYAIGEEVQSFLMGLQKKAGEKGYLTPGWPDEYGGLGLTAIEQGIVNEEQACLGLRWPSYLSFNQAGPAVLLFGTEEQKAKFIPPIARGEQIWLQAFTEPEAGSDEANVQLRAIKDGDDYILNGQKTFISHTHKPDYLYTLAKTADVTPKHRGLSLFLIPGVSPGIAYRPLPTMGFGTQNEIFFDDVRVSKEHLLGELNRGFYHAMATFEFERAGTHWAARAKRELEEFVRFCKEEKRNGKPLIECPEARDILAQRAIEVEIIKLVGWSSTWRSGEKERLGPMPPSASSRFYYKLFADRWVKDAIDILGLFGQLKKSSKWAKLAGHMECEWQDTRSMHGGGTIEIYKDVLARRGLGLPRPPRPVTTKTEKKL